MGMQCVGSGWRELEISLTQLLCSASGCAARCVCVCDVEAVVSVGLPQVVYVYEYSREATADVVPLQHSATWAECYHAACRHAAPAGHNGRSSVHPCIAIPFLWHSYIGQCAGCKSGFHPSDSHPVRLCPRKGV